MPYTKWELFAWSIEWDGSVFLTKNGCKKLNRIYNCISPRISFVSKDKILLEEMLKIIDRGIIYHYGVNRYQWRICKLEDLNIILPKIIPHLLTKQKKALIVLEWVKSRIKHPKSSYDQKELKIYKKYLECD